MQSSVGAMRRSCPLHYSTHQPCTDRRSTSAAVQFAAGASAIVPPPSVSPGRAGCRPLRLRPCPQYTAGDDEALDLLGALVDLRDLGVAHVALSRVLLDVAVAAKELQRVDGDSHGH